MMPMPLYLAQALEDAENTTLLMYNAADELRALYAENLRLKEQFSSTLSKNEEWLT